MKIPFLNLTKLHKKLAKEINKAISTVTQNSNFILGEEVKIFEQEFADYCGTKFAVGLNSGTDALFLSLTAMDIGPGDEVIVPAFTFIATANAVSYTGAKPVFVDINEQTYNIDPLKIEKAVTKKTKAIIPAHLFGQCCDISAITRAAKRYQLKVIEDACQAHGAMYYKRQGTKGERRGIKAGSMSNAGCFSFYPTKNLGGFGDGGMVVTNDKNLYEKLMLLRDCGRKSHYEHIVVGYNSRLDTIQAAVLRVKLKYLDQWNKMREYNARLYDKFLENREDIIKPFTARYSNHVYHIYAIRVKNQKKVMENFKAKGISAAINYPIPLPLQKAYSVLGYCQGNFPIAEKVCQEIISLPMHPLLTKKEIKYVTTILKEATEE